MPDIVADLPAASDAALTALAQARHGDPFAILGPHEGPRGRVIRAMLPHALAVELLDRATGLSLGVMHRAAVEGLWEVTVTSDVPYRFRIETAGGGYDTEDPYSFPTLLGELDIYLLAEGRHRDLGHVLGAHATEIDGVSGVRFAVWAPNARRVSVVGDFNEWDGRRHPMRLRHGPGVWELFIPHLRPGTLYKYELLGPDGGMLPLKADPVAWAAEIPPATASIVPQPGPLHWTDDEWLQTRAARHAANAPISIYEVHAQSWLGPTADTSSVWEQLTRRLIPYVKGIGFTHIELMPIMEHPFGGSWGYQPLGQFAPSARLGTPEAFARFVDHCHAAGIGVILDWVPAHFPTDAHGLARFDGTPLYEHGDPREGFHQDWNTYIFNLGRNEVRGFLIASALFWLEHYHVDGLRVDAVASMLYRDYSRREGEWIPNIYGGRENLESVSFLQELSQTIVSRCPGAALIAEESTAWPGVTRPAGVGGLGFDYKWNMGWMHDTLHYMQEEPVHRQWHHHEITFGLIYAFSEKFILPLSHDEVVYGKRSLIEKMPGDRWQKFANLRAYYAFMWTHPGKKLLFMGCDIAQPSEWDHDAGLQWHLLDDPMHRGVQTLLRDLNSCYRGTPALHQLDTEGRGFRWLVLDDSQQSVYAYLRFGEDGAQPALIACNFTPVPRYNYRLGVPEPGLWREIVNTDAGLYGGSNLGNAGAVQSEAVAFHTMDQSVALTLPPLATVILVRA